ncbi:MAG: Gfo/Idh/MocA family oxidoreductase [Planctomycetota bacterium]|nr:Gfo/Idh/MocA family oxidoreductase [Planctomycetota bacterium]
MRNMKTIKFGIIGCGLMGREFASAAARWGHLLDLDVRPELVAICDKNAELFGWYRTHFPTIKQFTGEHKDLLANPEVEAIYCAVPHNLHADLYRDIVAAGKHLLGEKPFGIDAAANARIQEALQANPKVFVRCSSEFPFFPAAQRIVKAAREGRFGTMLEVSAGLHHSSDMDPHKPINWKRMVKFNGEYGCMGDLGMHALHIPLRLGWKPKNVRAILSKIVKERPDGKGGKAPCETWDNATLLCTAVDPRQNAEFPMTISTKRISPGDTNTWFISVKGTSCSMEFNSRYPKTLRTLEYVPGGEQAWREEDLGYQTAFKSITGHIFEFGFSDAILQMWAAFCMELAHGPDGVPFGCVKPEETVLQHKLFTAALQSHKENQVISIDDLKD